MSKTDHDRARAFFRDIRKAEKLAPVYLFYGEERFLVDRAVDEVVKRLFGDETPDPFCFEVFRGIEAKGRGRDVADAARTVAMLGGTRLVVLRAADELDERDLGDIAAYVKAPSRRSVMVITATKIDGRKASWKSLRQHAETVVFKPLYRNQMAQWIVRQGQRHKLRVSPPAADYLAEAVGTDMTMVDLALEKLALLCSDGTVALEHARIAVAETRERSVFELTDALSARDLEGALRALRSLREQDVSHIPIGFMIARHVRLLMRLKSGQDKGLNEVELASFVGVNKFFLKGYLSGARRYQTSELIQLHGLLFEADRALKSSRLPGDIIIERVLAAFCLPAPAY